MAEDTDLRASIEAAMGEAETEVDTSVDTSTETPDTSTERDAVDKPPVEGRDSLGRFLKKDGDNAPAAAPGDTPAPEQSAVAPTQPAEAGAAAPTAVQPPNSWGPAVREKWASLPPEVQQHVAQREVQMQRWANETAPMRQAGEAFMQAIQPFQHAITAEGVDPITAVRNLMQVGTTLRFGTPAEKAGTVAKLVKAYGVDITALDGALVGETPPPGQGVDQQTIQALVQQQLAPLYQAAQARQAQAAQAAEGEARSTLEQFASDTANEFFGTVREEMADIIEVAERQGRSMTLKDAYDRACMLHPEVSRVIMARRQGSAAQDLTRAAAKAKGAAVSVKGGAPVGNPDRAEPSSVRESIEAAIAAHSRV